MYIYICIKHKYVYEERKRAKAKAISILRKRSKRGSEKKRTFQSEREEGRSRETEAYLISARDTSTPEAEGVWRITLHGVSYITRGRREIRRQRGRARERETNIDKQTETHRTWKLRVSDRDRTLSHTENKSE